VPNPYRMAVVGFGMAGATTAYLLAKAGHRVTLFERAAEVHPVGAGIILQPSGQAVLRHLGVLDQVVAHSAPLESLNAVHWHGRTMIRNRYPEFEPGCTAYGTHRGVLFDALKSLVETQPVEVRLGTEITRRTVSDNVVTLTDTTGRRHGPFDFLVCGDGSRSTLRPTLGSRYWSWPYDHGTLWAIAPGHGVPRELLQIVRRNRYLSGLLPLGDGLVTLYWGLPVRDLEATRRRGLEPLKREIVAFCPQAAEPLEFIHDWDQLLFTTYRANWMARRFDRHTLFIGDAAHAMSPHLGQGINLAMVDAWVLAGCVAETHSPLEAFRLWHLRQAGYLRYYAAVTFFLSPFFQSDCTILGWGRDVVLPWLPKLPLMKRQMLMTVAGLKGGWLKGRREI
jgi:2-polyprenyl-6-methoxyphenol hydroxylase-like FAD-dependent oxidoreductase